MRPLNKKSKPWIMKLTVPKETNNVCKQSKHANLKQSNLSYDPSGEEHEGYGFDETLNRQAQSTEELAISNGC
ncbi:hypothetical protein TNCT_490371 [Trichonephila clavata]|uniref:Uncharacterized protein n=1 Tax=Trichonephila clavata TaxID=2740835 RepID=A0A8X6HGD5_TRICU|nr:hypothetical protein TNCT_490371 [Trichonephila clavata]